jgi:hypothetical protein
MDKHNDEEYTRGTDSMPKLEMKEQKEDSNDRSSETGSVQKMGHNPNGIWTGPAVREGSAANWDSDNWRMDSLFIWWSDDFMPGGR